MTRRETFKHSLQVSGRFELPRGLSYRESTVFLLICYNYFFILSFQTLDADISRFKKENKELRQQFELIRNNHEHLKVRSQFYE